MTRSILETKTTDELWDLSAYQGTSDIIQPEEVTHLLKLCRSYWMHADSGDITHPHVKLTSGKHSNGFVDVLRMLTYPNLCRMLGRQMAILATDQIKESGGAPPRWVIGSSYASITLSFAVASALRGARHALTEKDPTPGSKGQLWPRFGIAPTEPVLQIEELVTTSLTLKEVRKGIRAGNPYEPIFSPVAVTLVHRSKETHIEDAPILCLAHYDIDAWDEGECPLCAAGSPVIEKPKENWDQLVHVG